MPHQREALNATKDFNKVAYYHDMGLGKTFSGSEKLAVLNTEYNLVICQKSKVNDWVNHFKQFYPELNVIDYTKPKAQIVPGVIIINYELAWRRPELSTMRGITLMLDESSLIQNENAKRSKFILKHLNYKNVILLSGTPVSGKYERMWSQCRLLGWNISKKDFYARYIVEREIKIKNSPFPIKIVVDYKNVEELKFLLKHHGAHFLKTEDVLSLPEQTFIKIDVNSTTAYQKFRKNKIVEIDGETLIGDTALTRMLYERLLCGAYNKNKLDAFADLLDSTDDRLIVFYNFNKELDALIKAVGSRPYSVVNGSTKDLTAYENDCNSVTFCQYQAASMGLNLQKANKIVYFSLPLSCEFWMQSQKRTHRIKQDRPCFYYLLVCKDSVDKKIYETLQRGVDYTVRLFE